MPEVNYCASYPDRSPTAIYDAQQCTGSRSVYVPLSEKEGYYDECLTPARVRELTILATARGLHPHGRGVLALERPVLLAPRVAPTPTAGASPSPGSRPATGGVVMVGDSLTWRGTDELTRLRPTFTVDGEPARQLSALKDRLDGVHRPQGPAHRRGHRPRHRAAARRLRQERPRADREGPAQVGQRDARDAVRRERPRPRRPRTPSKIDGWMKSIAKGRSKTCLADWPAYVRGHAGLLQDGVHVKRHVRARVGQVHQQAVVALLTPGLHQG